MFQFNSLLTRTFSFISSSLVLVMLFFSYYSINNKEEALIDVINSKAKTIVKSIALVSSDAMVTEDYSFIVQHNERVAIDNDEIEYLIVSKKNTNSNIVNDKSGWSITADIPAVLRATELKVENAKILKSKYSNNVDVYHFSYPIVFSGIEWGWVSIGYSLKEYHENMRSNYIDSFILLLITLILSFAFTYFVTKWLVGPIVILKNAARQVSAGDLSVNVPILTNDEIGELAQSFNNMVQTIKLSDKKLRNSNIELEQRVEMRTKELHELNISLDKRVKDEINKRSEQEQLLIQQSRFAAMGEMIGNIAHQWRQPLNALSLLLQNIENAYEMDMLNEEYITRTVAKGNKLTGTMSQTIDDFRNFFKPNKEATVFSILSTLESSLDMIKSSFANHMIEVTYDVPEDFCVKGFSSEFSQVLLNILNNAKDALIENKIENKKIIVSAMQNDKNIFIYIEDNAGGIPVKIMNSIFDPYFTTKEEGKGTGIGLYMSKTIIENNMKGQLSVVNTAEGAKFSIKIKMETCDEGTA